MSDRSLKDIGRQLNDIVALTREVIQPYHWDWVLDEQEEPDDEKTPVKLDERLLVSQHKLILLSHLVCVAREAEHALTQFESQTRAVDADARSRFARLLTRIQGHFLKRSQQFLLESPVLNDRPWPVLSFLAETSLPVQLRALRDESTVLRLLASAKNVGHHGIDAEWRRVQEHLLDYLLPAGVRERFGLDALSLLVRLNAVIEDRAARPELAELAETELRSIAVAEQVTGQFRELWAELRATEAGGRPAVPHFIAVGESSVDASLAVRSFARLLRAYRVLPYGHIHELVPDHFTQYGVVWGVPPAKKFAAHLRQAQGGVLLIHDLPGVLDDMDLKERSGCIRQLSECMNDSTRPTSVVLAGSSRSVRKVLDLHADLAKAFGRVLSFPTPTAQELERIFLGRVQVAGLSTTPELVKELRTFLGSGRARVFGGSAYLSSVGMFRLFEGTIRNLHREHREAGATGNAGPFASRTLDARHLLR